MKRVFVATVACLALVAALSAFDGSPAAPDPAKVDAVFARWTAQTPGCAVGVAEDGKVVLEKAYGMADLEHDAPNAADTIFEAGSVSKQFTAAAVLLLAREGKLSLDDQARKYIPELPDYGKPHDYALGLYIRTFMGVPEVGHSGSTAGYRAYLARFPRQRVSVTVLCNVSTGEADRYAHQVAALYLGNALTPPAR
jgi:CubicO group peptidase (beta-lactamase class C family)